MGFPIAPNGARYIKLGYGNAWFESCKANDRVELGHALVPHAVALSGDREAVAAIYRTEGRTPGKATSFAREVLEFYGLGDDHLWITFAQGCLWWAFAKPQVEMLGETRSNGQRARALVAPWSNLDANGQVLTINSLSTRLTQVASYRQTLCKVEALSTWSAASMAKPNRRWLQRGRRLRIWSPRPVPSSRSCTGMTLKCCAT